MKKRIVAVLVVVIALASVGFWLFKTGRIGRKPPPSNELTLYGNVDIRQVELGFRIAGQIKSMQLEEGQPVKAGAVMAELDTRALEDQLHAAQAQVAAQDANLKKLLTGSRPAEIARARAAVDEATAAQENARTELDRTERLVKEKALAQANLDTATAISRQADARLASANESLRLFVQGSRIEDISAARAQLQLAQANVASVETSLDDAKLVAPSDGVVISRVKEPGAIVSPNDIVYVVSLTHSVWVRAYVSETQLGRVHPGIAASVITDAAPAHPFKAHVGYISPTAEFTPKSVETPELRTDLVYRMRIIVDDADEGLRQGMPVTIKIDTSGG